MTNKDFQQFVMNLNAGEHRSYRPVNPSLQTILCVLEIVRRKTEMSSDVNR